MSFLQNISNFIFQEVDLNMYCRIVGRFYWYLDCCISLFAHSVSLVQHSSCWVEKLQVRNVWIVLGQLYCNIFKYVVYEQQTIYTSKLFPFTVGKMASLQTKFINNKKNTVNDVLQGSYIYKLLLLNLVPFCLCKGNNFFFYIIKSRMCKRFIYNK